MSHLQRARRKLKEIRKLAGAAYADAPELRDELEALLGKAETIEQRIDAMIREAMRG